MTQKTRSYDVRRLAMQPGMTGPNGSWHTRAAAMYLTDDGHRLLSEIEPVASAAGLRTRLVTHDRRHLVINRVRVRLLPWIRFYRHIESWSAYPSTNVLATFRQRYHWDPDDVTAEQQWTSRSEGHQIIVWDPAWGRDDRLWPALRECGLDT